MGSAPISFMSYNALKRKMIDTSKSAIACVILIFAFAVNAANAQEPLSLTYLTEPIQIDGLSDEPGWQRIKPLPVIMYKPIYRGEPTERTEIRIAYDTDYFYCSARCYDTDTSGIRVNSLYRDRSSKDDKFGIITTCASFPTIQTTYTSFSSKLIVAKKD